MVSTGTLPYIPSNLSDLSRPLLEALSKSASLHSEDLFASVLLMTSKWLSKCTFLWFQVYSKVRLLLVMVRNRFLFFSPSPVSSVTFIPIYDVKNESGNWKEVRSSVTCFIDTIKLSVRK